MIPKLLYDLSVIMGYKNPEIPVYESFEQQESVEKISSAEVRTIAMSTTGIDVICPFDNADLSYKLTDIPTLKLFAAKNNLARYKYIKNDKDCDDFSFMLQGDMTHWDSDLAFGIIWGVRPNGEGHAWNWCIGTDKQMWFIEPQSNYVFKPIELWKITKLVM